MAWFDSVRSFHATCLNSLASSLARSSDVPWEKVQKLMDSCPAVGDGGGGGGRGPGCVLHDRGLSAVLALGRFAVESQLKFHEARIVGYLLRLLRSLPSSQWVQNTQAAARREGVVAEQFCYKLGLVLVNIAALSATRRQEILSSLMDVFEAFAKQFLEIVAMQPEKACLIVVPALIGLMRAMQGGVASRREAFWQLFQGEGREIREEGEHDGTAVMVEEITFGVDATEKLVKLTLDILNPMYLKTVDSLVEELPPGVQGGGQKNPLSSLLQSLLLSLLRDFITTCQQGLESSLCVRLAHLAETQLSSGVRDLSSGGSSPATERAHYIVTTISIAVEILVWAVQEDAEVESAFQRLSSLLTVHTPKFNILVSPLRATILEGISALVEKCHSLASLALQRFREFLASSLLYGMYSDAMISGNVDFATAETPKAFQQLRASHTTSVHISRIDAFTTVQLALGNAVCRTLLAGSQQSSDYVAAFLASLGNKLYTSDSGDERALRSAECIVMLLGQLAVTVGGKHGVMETVVATFQQRMFHPASSLDGSIVIELGKMGAKTGDHTTLEVLSRLMSQSLGETAASHTQRGTSSFRHIYQPMVDALLHVAKHLSGVEQRHDLMLRALQLFVQQGIEAKKASDRADAPSSHKATSSSFSLGLLLPVIATLAQRMDRIEDPSQRVGKLFRDFWLYCIIMGFSETEMGVFPPRWYSSVRDIARNSPLLLSMGAEQYLDKELEINHPLKIENIAPGELQEARQSLVDQLGKSPELDRLVYRLTFVQCMYLHSVYRLESLRLENDTKLFPLIFQYLEDKGLHGELWVAIEAIANKLFEQYLNQMESKPATQSRTEELETYAQLLVFKFNHLRGRIKQIADQHLSKLIDKFPHVLWSCRVVNTMLDLLHELSLTLYSLEPSERRAVEVKLPYLPHTITMPENVQKREKTVSYFATRCEQILDLATKLTPTQTRTILEEYVCQLGVASSGLTHHSGVSLAVSLMAKHFQLNHRSKHLPAQVTVSRPPCIKDSLSHSSSTLHLRSRYMGEVQGMRLASHRRGQEEHAALKELSAMLISQLQDALEGGTRDQITAAFYRATAHLISTDGIDRSLLFNISQLPVRVFTEVAIATAVECWHWLLTSRPDMEYPFMREFAAVWKWTVEERKGVFTPTAEPGGRTGVKPQSVPVKQHMLLIKFLSNRFEVISTRDSAQVQLIAEILHQSLTLGVGPSSTQQQYLSHAPEVTTARFSLLSLGVRLLRGELISSTLERTILRERIYSTILDFFCYDLTWPVQDSATVRETITTLVKFWQSLKELKNTAVISPLPASALEVTTSLPHSTSSFWQLALSAETSHAQGSWMNTLGSGKSSRHASLSLPQTLSVKVPSGGHSRGRSSTATKNKVLLKRRNVILALVRQEIERLTAWHNPSGSVELAIPGEDVVNGWVNPTQSERHWRSTIIMAYQSSPHLAFQLINRFRSLDVIPREISRLIHSDPVSFIDIPDAAHLLAKKESVIQDVPELYHLLYWRNIPPASALTFFYKPFSHHPITAQFANKAMHSFKPDDILLYIPQLVQALRYDKLGFARAYLLTAAQRSQLLAHQFLWNMEANTFMDDEGKQKDPEIGDLLGTLSQEIQQALSGAALKFYKREFSFFEKVTNISGIIRPFPKSQRKKECLKALREVRLESGVYLPSNPDSVVLSIDYESGTPMQSAAKAPFLAKFRVAKCGTDEVENMNTAEDQDFLEAHSTKLLEGSIWQASIFKVGDDVRQDILALQIIQVFKDVFQGVGLDLYLVPYRVVATASGCGVIECVPDCKSRDQLGKQTEVSLKDYFHSTYGDEDAVGFQQARANFIKSMAAYSLVSYLLQIKDRHNGNIMVDKQGHIIHIDFGFLFESSPGGNLGFEPDLKLTEEMLELMGGKKSDPYRWFLELCVQGYLALRPSQEQVVSLVCLMLDTGFSCFRGNTIDELRARFRPHLGEREAAKAIIEVVESSCLNFRTYGYDLIQDAQQKIYYYKKT